MFLTPTNQIKRKLAREFCKIQSKLTPFDFRVDDRCVINNKPHIVLKNAVVPANPYAGMPYMTLSSLMGGMQLPQEEDYIGEEDEMENVNKSGR